MRHIIIKGYRKSNEGQGQNVPDIGKANLGPPAVRKSFALGRQGDLPCQGQSPHLGRGLYSKIMESEEGLLILNIDVQLRIRNTSISL